MKVAWRTVFQAGFAALLVTVLAGCRLFDLLGGAEGLGTDVPGAAKTNQAGLVDPVIRAGHYVRIGVTAAGKAEVQEMPREVSAKGEILMPLIGAVACDGLSTQALQKKLEELYAQYIHEPQVSVSFIYSPEGGGISPWGTVLVMGEVNRKGPVNIPPTRDLTVMKAIQLAGGTTPIAALSKVYVTRKVSETERKRIEVNLTVIGKQGDTSQDITLQPDDVVFIPETFM